MEPRSPLELQIYVCLHVFSLLLPVSTCTQKTFPFKVPHQTNVFVSNGDFTGGFTEETKKGAPGTHHSHQLKQPIWMFLFFKAPPLLLTSRRVLSSYLPNTSLEQPAASLAPFPSSQIFLKNCHSSLSCRVTQLSLSSPTSKYFFN